MRWRTLWAWSGAIASVVWVGCSSERQSSPQPATVASSAVKEAEGQLAGLLEEDWEAYLREEPTFASLQGDTRYAGLWEIKAPRR